MTGKPEDVVEETLESHEDLFNSMYPSDGANLEDEEIEIEEEEETPEVVAEQPPAGRPVVDPATPAQHKPAEEDPYAWITALPDEYRDSASRLRHEALSDRGRVSALSKKLNEMHTALEAMKSRATVTSTGLTNPKKSTAPEPPESLRQLKEDYPELGRQLDEIFAFERTQAETLIDSRLQPLQEKISADTRKAEQDFLDREAAKIFNTEETGVHWKDIVTSEDFDAWIEKQPTFIQTTARTTNSASEGLEILRMYERDYQAVMGSTQQAAPVTSQPDEDALHGDKLKAQRAKRKASTVSPSSRPVGSDTDSMSGDHEAMFNSMWSTKKTSRR